MKRIVKIPILLSIAVFLAACAQATPDADLSGPVAARVTAGVSTRAVGTSWSGNESIGVIVSETVNVGSSMTTKYKNAKYVTTDTGLSADFDPYSADDDDDTNTVYFDNDSDVTFSAYCPFSGDGDDPSTLPGTSGVISGSTEDQTSTQESIDCLYASGATASKTSPTVAYEFHHVMSNIVFDIVAGNGYTAADIQGGTYSFGGVYLTGTFDVTSGTAAADTSTDPAETWYINQKWPAGTTTESGITYTGIIYPQTSSSLNFYAKIGEAEFTTDNLLTTQYLSGYTYKYTVSIASDKITVTGTIIYPWKDAAEEADYTPSPLYLSELENEDYTILNNTTISGDLITPYTGHLTVSPAVTELTFYNVNIDCGYGDSSAEDPGISITSDLTLTLTGTNTIKLSEGESGKANECIKVDGSVTLTITGDGSLTLGADVSTGKLTALDLTGGASLVIESGSVTAVSEGMSPGIGAASGNCGDITISGGTVNATGGAQSAAIGGSNSGTCGNILISGGEVTATCGSGNGAAIGAGVGRTCGTITISGGSVTATSLGNYSSTIGCSAIDGTGSTCGNIYITDNVTMVNVQGGGSIVYHIGPDSVTADTATMTVYLGGSSATDESVTSWTPVTSPYNQLNTDAQVYGWNYSAGTWTKNAD